MAGPTSSVKTVHLTAKAAAQKWSSLLPAKAKAKASATGHTTVTTHKQKQPSVAKPDSEVEAVVVKPIKKAQAAPKVEDEVVTTNEQEEVEESEDVVELDDDDKMEEREVSLYPHT
jgi:hypothetical protein